MKEHAKTILILVAAFLGLVIGYALGKPIIAGLMLWLLGTGGRDVELYNELRDGLPGIFGGFIGAAVVAWGFAFAAERLLGRYGFPGLILSADEELANSTIYMQITVVSEGKPPFETRRVTVFSSPVSAAPLVELFRHNLAGTVVFQPVGGLEAHFSRSTYSASDVDGQDQPLAVTIKSKDCALYAFEVMPPGKFRAPEGKNVAFCRFKLRYRGCEEDHGALLAFKGAKPLMKDIFLP